MVIRSLLGYLRLADRFFFLLLEGGAGFELFAERVREDEALLDRGLLENRYERHRIDLGGYLDIVLETEFGQVHAVLTCAERLVDVIAILGKDRKRAACGIAESKIWY